MATQFITDDRTTAQTVGSNETLYLAASGSVLVIGATALVTVPFSVNARIVVMGEVAGIGALGAGIDAGFGNAIPNARIEVGAVGLVTGGLWGIGLVGHGSSLVNAGWVTGGQYGVTITSDTAVDPGSAHTVLTNSGTITGGDDGVRMIGALIDGSNTGTITAADAGGTGLRFQSVGGAFVNFGTITGQATGVLVSGDGATLRNGGGIASGGTAILVSGDPAWIESSGTLEAGRHGIEVTLTDVPGSTLVNTGAIAAGLDGIRVLAPAALIRSTGNIEAGRDGITLSGTGGQVLTDGRIVAGASGVVVTGTSTDVAVGGVVTAALDGIRVTGDFASVTVTAQVFANGDSGLAVTGDNGRVVISGNITGEVGLQVAGLGGRIANDGDVLGRSYGLVLSDFDPSGPTDGVFRVTNNGLIDGQFGGVSVDAGRLVLLNTGTVRATEIAALQTADPAKIVNGGLIAAGVDGDAILFGAGVDVLRNSGRVLGDVEAGASNDTIRNTGDIDGDVRTGDGGDLFNGAGGSVSGTIDGGAGFDTLTGGLSDDSVLGGQGNDRISGRGGDDTLRAGVGFDTLTGGSGADRFVFAWGGEAGAPFNGDIITDFRPGEDRIDLSAFMPGAAFIGSAAFQVGFGNSIRYDAAQGRIFLETTADGVADFGILLLNRPASLSAADFIVDPI